MASKETTHSFRSMDKKEHESLGEAISRIKKIASLLHRLPAQQNNGSNIDIHFFVKEVIT
jgi:hypothetical protein